MTKGLKALFATLIFIIGVLALSTGFLYAKIAQNNDSASDDQIVKTETKKAAPVTNSSPVTTPVNQETSTNTNQPVAATAINDKPFGPIDTYKIVSGDTLSIVAEKVGLSWQTLAKVNGITNPDSLKIGQILALPKNNQLNFGQVAAKVAELQKQADSGKNAFRLLPLDTAKADASPFYNLKTTDSYKLVSSSNGNATVTVTSGAESYQITLVQPGTKGDKGIWVISAIKPVK